MRSQRRLAISLALVLAADVCLVVGRSGAPERHDVAPAAAATAGTPGASPIGTPAPGTPGPGRTPGPGAGAPSPVPTATSIPAAADVPPPPLGANFPVAPYADPRFLLADPKGPELSAFAQPWRGYLETRSARELAAGVGVNYNLPHDADHAAVVALLARAGIRHLRFELPFSAIGMDGRLKPAEARVLGDVLRAAKRHGIRPMLLLNGHGGAPGPHTSVERRLVTAAPKGSRVLVLDDVSGLVPGRSGLSNLTGYWMTEVLFTRVDPTAKTVELSRPLPVDLPASAQRIDTLRYAPLHPVGTRQFDDSAGGWLAYTSRVLDALAANGIADFDVELWNELTIAPWWLQVDRYYDPPLYGSAPDFLRPGGTAWELARRTTDLVKRRAPRSRVVWGFSNTTFLHTPPAAMPPRTDAESYHPYGSGIEQYPAGLDTRATWEHGFVPRIRKVMPEGWAHLGTRHEQLPKHRLAPSRRPARPPGTTRYLHFLSEHGVAPREIGIRTESEAQAFKAAAALRSLGFWLNKGVDVVDLFCAYDTDPAGFGLLRSDVAPRDYGRVNATDLMTPQLRALANFTAPLAGATAAKPTQLSVAATSFGAQPEVFTAGQGHPALPYRDLLALLPFQVSAERFVVGAYVMSYDVTRPPPPMGFRVTLGKLPFDRARVSLLDPATGTTTAVAAYRGRSGEVISDVTLDDRFRWLVVESA